MVDRAARDRFYAAGEIEAWPFRTRAEWASHDPEANQGQGKQAAQ